jgi:hypothetical protein
MRETKILIDLVKNITLKSLLNDFVELNILLARIQIEIIILFLQKISNSLEKLREE